MSNLTWLVRRQAEEALALATARTGKLGGWSREARDPATLRRALDLLARNSIVLANDLDEAQGFEQALRRIADEPPDRGLTPDFRQYARAALEANQRRRELMDVMDRTELVRLFEKRLETMADDPMRRYWEGRIDGHCLQNAIDEAELQEVAAKHGYRIEWETAMAVVEA